MEFLSRLAVTLFAGIKEQGDEYVNNIKPLREGTGEYHIGFYEELPAEQR